MATPPDTSRTFITASQSEAADGATPDPLHELQARVAGLEAQNAMLRSALAGGRAQRLADALIYKRVELTRFAAGRTLAELLQKMLDDLGELTGSPIGFCHLVEADQQSLSLQAWSTRTLNELCTAAGEGTHYPVAQAGVWADCVRMRKPVVHNDYASLPHRTGLPSGHALVVRELVVPILREERVVAVLGVGNKPVDYTPDDVDLVAGLADLVWDIAEHKRAEMALSRKNRALLTISGSNQALLRARDEQSLLNDICRICVEQGGYRMAWAGFAEHDENRRVRPVAQSGFEDGYLDTIHITWADAEHGRGPTGTAIRANRPAIARHIMSDPAFAPWREAAVRRGYASTIALPLPVDGHVLGALNIYAAEPDAFDADEVALLSELAGDLAYGLGAMRSRAERTRAETELADAYDLTIEGWSRALDLRDHETEGHTQRVTDMTLRLAQAAGLAAGELVHVRRGALLHDIGKMGIPDAILNKPGPLDADEWVIMRRHPEMALAMLAPIAYLRPALDIPGSHHEKWDGTGYPHGLKGEQIPLAARLFAVVDVWDALSSDRPYRAGWPQAKVLEHIRALSGTHFDPRAVELFLRVIAQDAHPGGAV